MTTQKDKGDNGLVPLPPLGAYLAAYFTVCRNTLSLTMSESAATAQAATMATWKVAARGIMALLSAPSKVRKGKQAKIALTTEQHLSRLYFDDAATMGEMLKFGKEARTTWDASRTYLKVQHGWDVGPMPQDYPARLKARVDAQASADATDAAQNAALAQVTATPDAPAIPAATVLVPLVPGSPILQAVEGPLVADAPASETSVPVIPASDVLAGDAPEYKADNGELPTPETPQEPATNTTDAPSEPLEPVADPLDGDTPPETANASQGDAGPSSEPVAEHACQTTDTNDAPEGVSVGSVGGGETEVSPVHCADPGCATCEPEAVSIPEARPIVVVTPTGVAAFMPNGLTLDALPAGETEPVRVEAPLDGGPSVPEVPATVGDTGPSEQADLATDGTHQNGDAPAADVVAPEAAVVDGLEAPESGLSEPAQEATAQTSEGEADALPLEGSAHAETACAAVSDAGPQQSGPSEPEPVGSATEPTALVEDASVPFTQEAAAMAEAVVAASAEGSSPLQEPASAEGGNGGTVIAGDASMAIATVDVPRIVMEPDEMHAQLAEFDARLSMAWSDHMAGPTEASARLCRSIAREAFNTVPKLFGSTDLYAWREKTRAWIPQTNNAGRKAVRVTPAAVEATLQEASITPEQEQTSAIAAEARKAMLGDAAAHAGVVRDDVQ